MSCCGGKTGQLKDGFGTDVAESGWTLPEVSKGPLRPVSLEHTPASAPGLRFSGFGEGWMNTPGFLVVLAPGSELIALRFTPNPWKEGSLIGFESWAGHFPLPSSCQILYISGPRLPHLSNGAVDLCFTEPLRGYLS